MRPYVKPSVWLSVWVAVCLSWDLFDFCESLAATDWRHVVRAPSPIFPIPFLCPVLCVSRLSCVLWPAFVVVAVFVFLYAGPHLRSLYILLGFPCKFFSHLWLKHVNTQRAICLKCALWFMPSPSQIANFLSLWLHCMCVWYVWYIYISYLLASFGKQNPC